MSDDREKGLDYASLRAVLATQTEQGNIEEICEVSGKIAQVFASRDKSSSGQKRLGDLVKMLEKIQKSKTSQVNFYTIVKSLYASITEEPNLLGMGYTFKDLDKVLNSSRNHVRSLLVFLARETRSLTEEPYCYTFANIATLLYRSGTVKNAQALIDAARLKHAKTLMSYKFPGIYKDGKQEKESHISKDSFVSMLSEVKDSYAPQVLEILNKPENLQFFHDMGFCATNITSIFKTSGKHTAEIIDALRKYRHLISNSDPNKFSTQEISGLLHQCKGQAEERLQAVNEHSKDLLTMGFAPKSIVSMSGRNPKKVLKHIKGMAVILKQEPYNFNSDNIRAVFFKVGGNLQKMKAIFGNIKKYKQQLTDLGFDNKIIAAIIGRVGSANVKQIKEAKEIREIIAKIKEMQELYGITREHVGTIFRSTGGSFSIMRICDIINTLDAVRLTIEQFGISPGEKISALPDEADSLRVLSLHNITKIYRHSGKNAPAYQKALQKHMKTFIKYGWSGDSITTLCEHAKDSMVTLLNVVTKNLHKLMVDKGFAVCSITSMLHSTTKSAAQVVQLILGVTDELISYGFVQSSISLLVARGYYQKNIDFALILGRTLIALGFEQKQLQDVLSSYSTKDTLMIMMDLYECYDKTCKAPAQMLERYRGLSLFSESMSMFDIKYVQSFLEARGEVVPEPDLERTERKRKQPLIDMAEYKEVLISASVDTGQNRGKRMMDDLVRIYQYGKEKLQQLVSQFPQDKQNRVLEALRGFSSRLLAKGYTPDGLLEFLKEMKSWRAAVEYIEETAHIYDMHPPTVPPSGRGIRFSISPQPPIIAKRPPFCPQSVGGTLLGAAPDETSSPESARGLRLKEGSWQAYVREQRMLSAKRPPSPLSA